MTTIKSSTHNRLYGFDLIRIFSMIAILVLHTNEAVFWTDLHPLPTDFSIYRLVLAVAQTITYSGFTVIALSFFLLGRGRTLGLGKFILLLFFGLLVLAWFESDPPFSGFYWEWDIYAFLLCSAVAVFFLQKVPKLHALLVIPCLATLLIPFWEIIPNTVDVFSQALVGICPPYGSGSWPLLPWVAWPLLFFCTGSALKQSKTWQHRLQTISRRELAIWAALLGLSIPFWGAFYGVPIGPNFYCHTLRQPPLIFWAHFIWVLFAMRLSLILTINERLERLTVVRWISNLEWNRHFGLTYLTHLPLLGLGVLMVDWFWKEPLLFDLYFLLVMPVAEGLVRLFMRFKAKAA